MSLRVAFVSCLALLVGLSNFVSAIYASDDADADFFSATVEPLLRDKCLSCHSHEAGQMEGGLTLDSQSGWSTGGDRGPAVVPGKPDESPLITAIRYNDADLQMPPDKRLTDDEIAALVDWVERGAPDPRKATVPVTASNDWWSLQPLRAPAVPGDGHPIDAFVRARLGVEGLQNAEPADRITLARRLYVDLLGFLPSPEEVSQFVNDQNPQATSNLVNRLLASSHYGERWARHWLDVIHFADSHGCEHDVKRPNAWRFRDYVIDRFNADVPWDRFIREQLAADALYADEPQLTAALGFIAAGPLELSRASTAPVTFDYLDRDDMVTQTMAAFVSTTANCARCHAHKFDPVSQEDYYALQAVFAGVGKGDIEYDASAEVSRTRQEMNLLLTAATTRDASLLLHPKHAEAVRQWCAAYQSAPVQWSVLEPEVFVASGGAVLTRLEDSSILASGDVADQELYTVTGTVNFNEITAIRLEVLNDESLPQGGPGRAANGNLHLAEVEVHWFPVHSTHSNKAEVVSASADFDQDGWTSAQAIDKNLTTGWAIFPRVNEPHHIVFEFAEPLPIGEGGKVAVSLKQMHPAKHVIGRFRLSVTNADSATVQALPRDVSDALQKPAEQRSTPAIVAIAAVALEAYAKEQLAKLPPKLEVYGASPWWSHAQKLPAPQAPKLVHLLRRGDFDKPLREVMPGTILSIDALPGRFELPDPQQEAARRVELANWIANRDNPLTWRSVVNRVWHYHFGRGLCDTPNDFGRMGGQPSHPELLDWLAVWFRDEARGSLKELHKLILTSKTWQQSSLSASTPIYDSDNRLLWRMNRQRMDAETFRDSVLRISGQLDVTMGGPGIEQFQKTPGPQTTPTLDYTAFDWDTPGATRRSIYRVVWRGIPDPFMETMDFPDLGLLAPKRGDSVSALQSLAMFNNDFVLRGSEWLAQRVARERTALEDQVARVAELAWLRTPSASEQLQFSEYARQHGLAAFCRLVLNSNEFLFVD